MAELTDSTPNNVVVAGDSMPEVVAPVTFGQYEHVTKLISDETILSIMNDTLEVIPGERVLFLKTYFDQLPADKSDGVYMQDPERIGKTRGKLTDFVISKLVLSVHEESLGQEKIEALTTKLQSFRNNLRVGKQAVSDYVRTLFDTGDSNNPLPKFPRNELECSGLYVVGEHGNVDLLENKVEGVRSNILMQREIAALFVLYSSDGYVNMRLRGQSPNISRRMYLNPRIEDAVDIFDQIIDVANQEGIVMKGKILDRSYEAISDYQNSTGEHKLRGDGIVLYAGEDADKLLRIVEGVYMNNPNAFKGRKTSRIPLRIGDGVAIGDEPVGAEGASLTAHRVALLGNASRITKERLGYQGYELVPAGREADAIAMFKRVLEELAITAKVNSKNIAFNLPEAA